MTYVHELCHAVAALLSGGYVHNIVIHPNASGETYTSGGIGWLISSAGYVGTALIGVLCIQYMRLHANSRTVLLFFCAIAGWTAYYTGTTSAFGTIVGLGLAAAFGVVAISGHILLSELLAAFTSIQLLLNSFYDLKTLLILSAGYGVHTDAMNMQQATGIPAIAWAILWLFVSGYAAYRVLLSRNKEQHGIRD